MATKSPFSEQATSALSQDIGKAGKFAMQPLHSFEKLAGQLSAKDNAKAQAKAKKDAQALKNAGDVKYNIAAFSKKQAKHAADNMEKTGAELVKLLDSGDDPTPFIIQKELEAKSFSTRNTALNDEYVARTNTVTSLSSLYDKGQANITSGIWFQETADPNHPEYVTSWDSGSVNNYDGTNAIHTWAKDFKNTNYRDFLDSESVAGINFAQWINKKTSFTLANEAGNPAENPSEIHPKQVESVLADDTRKSWVKYEVLKEDPRYLQFINENKDEIWANSPETLLKFNQAQKLVANSAGGDFSDGGWIAQFMGKTETKAYDMYLSKEKALENELPSHLIIGAKPGQVGDEISRREDWRSYKGQGYLEQAINLKARDIMWAEQEKEVTATSKIVTENQGFSYGSGEKEKEISKFDKKIPALISGAIENPVQINGETYNYIIPDKGKLRFAYNSDNGALLVQTPIKEGDTYMDGLDEKVHKAKGVKWLTTNTYNIKVGDQAKMVHLVSDLSAQLAQGSGSKLTGADFTEHYEKNLDFFKSMGLSGPGTEEMRKIDNETAKLKQNIYNILPKSFSGFFDNQIDELAKDKKAKVREGKWTVADEDKYNLKLTRLKTILSDPGYQGKSWTEIWNATEDPIIDNDLVKPRP